MKKLFFTLAIGLLFTVFAQAQSSDSKVAKAKSQVVVEQTTSKKSCCPSKKDAKSCNDKATKKSCGTKAKSCADKKRPDTCKH